MARVRRALSGLGRVHRGRAARDACRPRRRIRPRGSGARRVRRPGQCLHVRRLAAQPPRRVARLGVRRLDPLLPGDARGADAASREDPPGRPRPRRRLVAGPRRPAPRGVPRRPRARQGRPVGRPPRRRARAVGASTRDRVPARHALQAGATPAARAGLGSPASPAATSGTARMPLRETSSRSRLPRRARARAPSALGVVEAGGLAGLDDAERETEVGKRRVIRLEEAAGGEALARRRPRDRRRSVRAVLPRPSQSLRRMKPTRGFEPRTPSLRVKCSTS